MVCRKLIVDQRFPLPARRLQQLVQQLLGVGKNEALRVIHEGQAQVNQRSVRKPTLVLEPGDRLEVDYEPLPPRAAPQDKVASRTVLQIVFEDEHLVVVNKPAALLTVPTPYRERVTLQSLLKRRLQEAGRHDARAYCVHRLDRGVSGLLVFGKRLDVAEALRDQFAARKPQRVYLAIVAGQLSASSGTFRSHLATDKDLNRYSTGNDKEGELAITHYRVKQAWPGGTLVEVRLETGRRNQIRVHFAEAGHPVWGDQRYGPDERRLHWPHRRLALHAQSLGFTHPALGTELSFVAPLPREMQAALPRA